jgi:copper resistance protein B
MNRLVLLALLPAAVATSALAQPADPHAGHVMPSAPAPAPDPHAGHRATAAEPAAPAADPHAGHNMPAAPAADPHAGHTMPAAPAADPHAGHNMPPPADPHAGHAAAGADLPVGAAAPPAAPADNLADRVYDAAAMERARRILRQEHGGARLSKTMIDLLEVRPASGGDAYAWEGELRYGGDINRFVLKTEGEGQFNHELEQGEVQALWSRAVGPYFDVQAGVRQDFAPRGRTYAVVGFEGLAPYWFELEGAVFLSTKGDLSARLEGSYDLRLTQRLILEPRAELTLSATDTPELGVGSGLSNAELGLRLRYEIRREFAPYVGVNFERSFGRTADLRRTAGEDIDDTRLVVGLRAWF